VAQKAGEKEAAAFGISARTARALADPWRFRILIEVNLRPLSPSRFVEEHGGELTHVARCFRQLAEWGYLEVAEERPGRRRGAAIEHVYRAIRRAQFDAYTWESVSHSERDSVSRSIRRTRAPSTRRWIATFRGRPSSSTEPLGGNWESGSTWSKSPWRNTHSKLASAWRRKAASRSQ
jgi:hypothetical protein